MAVFEAGDGMSTDRMRLHQVTTQPPSSTRRWRLGRLVAVAGAVIAAGSLAGGATSAEQPDGEQASPAAAVTAADQACLDESGVGYAMVAGEGGGPGAFTPPIEASDEERRAFTAAIEDCGRRSMGQPSADERQINEEMGHLYLDTYTRCLEAAGIKVEVTELQSGVHEIATPGVDLLSGKPQAIDLRCGDEAAATETAARERLGD